MRTILTNDVFIHFEILLGCCLHPYNYSLYNVHCEVCNLQKCLANNFYGVYFFQIFQRTWNQRKILRSFDIHMERIKKNFGSLGTDLV
jgi:hypothetical protein